MNWDQIKREWRGVCNRILLTWGKFSEDDLVFIDGDRGRFIDLYAQRYGIGGAKASSRVDDFARSLPPLSSPEDLGRNI